MNNFSKFLFFLIMMSVNFVSYGQEMKVTGTVLDSTGVRPVHNAVAMAVRMKDSLLLGFTRTNAKGEFELRGFEIDTFSLIIDHPGFDEKIYYIFGHADNYEINIPSVKMPMKSQELEEVVIYANKNPIFYRGDTLVYVADSFKVHEGAVVEDLLKKLPGIKVDKDGKITSQGQEIGKVLVDGDEFFGDDPTIATKNLGADGIAEVQIYEKENEDGIGGDDEKIQVLDLKLKEDAKKGYFGRISGATDFALTPDPITGKNGQSAFYETELLLNRFDGSQKISVFALGSNTPRSNFGWGDMNKFGLENESSGGNRWQDGNTSNTSGIPQTLKAGIYFSDKIGKKNNTKIGVNYSYYNDKLDATSASRSEYFLTDTSYVSDDSTRNYTANESHRFNLRFETKLDSLTTLEIKPSATIDKGISEASDISDFFGSDGFQTISTNIQNDNESKGYSVNGMARLHRNFKKKRREMEFKYDLAITNNETEGSLNSTTSYFSTSSLNDTIDQSRNNDNSNTSHYGTFTYIEPLGKKFKLEFEYLYEYGYGEQDKKTYDKENGSYTMLREDLSNVFENVRQQHRGGLALTYESRVHTITAGAKVRNIDIENINHITGITINQNFTNVLPHFNYQFKPSVSKRLNVNYRTRSLQPTINDLQPIPDNSNPNRIQEGNPDLRPNYVHTLNIGFNTWQALSGRYVYAGGTAEYQDDAFATSTTYDQFGRAVSKTVNVDGNIFAVFYGGAGLPLLGRKIMISPGINSSFNRNTNFIEGLANVTDNFAITGNLDLDFEWDSLEIGLTGSYSYNNPISSLNSASNTPFSIEQYGVDFEWRMPMGFTIGSEALYTRNSQPGEGFYNTEFFVWNAEISKSFLKTGNLVIAIIGNDILNQNINARRQVQGNIVTDYRTTIISRYFMLKATLRFNNRKAKEEDFNGMH